VDKLIDWLLAEEQKELYELLIALSLNLLFLLLILLPLWPLGRQSLASDFARGYALLWLALLVSAIILLAFQRLFRLDIYRSAPAYIISTLLVSCALQAAWAAYAAQSVSDSLHSQAGPGFWIAAFLYIIGGLSCYVASVDVASIYSGQIYRLVSLPFIFICYILFCVWPPASWPIGP
jgi:hypothetical protein